MDGIKKQLVELEKYAMEKADESGKYYQNTFEIAYQKESRAYRNMAQRIRKILGIGFGLHELPDNVNAQSI